ncbi:hypothetical protein RB595_004882 [Gaeumannomyces hyphopodioides]
MLAALETELKEAREQGYEAEVRQGRNAADAAAAVPTLERFVYSTLPPMKLASGGKYPHCLRWESKAAIVDCITRAEAEPLRSLARKTSLLYVGVYTTNAFLAPKPSPDKPGEYRMVLPCCRDTRFPIADPTEATALTRACHTRSPEYIGEFSYMAGVPSSVEPLQLKNTVETRTYEEFLKGRPPQELL